MAEAISARTRAALAKARGTRLGGFKGCRPSDADRAASVAKRGRAAGHAAPVVAEITASGRTSLRAIAAALEGRGIPSPGDKAWSSVTVMRLVGSAEGAALPAGGFPATASAPAGRSIGGP